MSPWGQTGLTDRLHALCFHTKEGKHQDLVIWEFGGPYPRRDSMRDRISPSRDSAPQEAPCDM